MEYCKRCVLPDTKPDLTLDEEGICSACRSYESRANIDWKARKKELVQILNRYKNKTSSNWDCIIPVSGGKDSTYQVLKMLELGMNPLCITATTCDLSETGRRNIENLQELGVDHIEVTANRDIRRRLNLIGLVEVGDISWPEHVSIFTLPLRVSVEHNIPLIIWGENSQNEYGGPASAQKNNTLDEKWIQEFGGLLGMKTSNLVGKFGIESKHLLPYSYPTDKQLKSVGTTGIFLGHYLPWDGYTNALIAQAHGLTTHPVAIEGSCVNYENLDNYQTGIHDYFKYLKYGFGRTSDLVSSHIRRGRLTREDGCNIVKFRDGRFPWSYLGKPLRDILSPLQLPLEEFLALCNKYTNREIFNYNVTKGAFPRDKFGDLIKLKYAENND